jgi:hypothetical protein
MGSRRGRESTRPIATALSVARKHPGRQELPADLPRVEQIIACTPEQCVCGKCGKQTDRIGYESSEQLDVEPAKYFVRVIKREKRACKDCEEQGVQSAPLPPRIIENQGCSDGHHYLIPTGYELPLLLRACYEPNLRLLCAAGRLMSGFLVSTQSRRLPCQAGDLFTPLIAETHRRFACDRLAMAEPGSIE